MSDTQIFDENGFFTALLADVSNARGLVLIKSTYVAARRIAKLLPAFKRCRDRGVHFVAFIQEPRTEFDSDEDQERIAVTTAAVSMLTSVGIELHYVPKIHEKLAIIDDTIVYTGCLNILSFNDTHEEMTRFNSRHEVKQTIIRHKLEKHASQGGRLPEWSLTHQKKNEEERKSFGTYVIARRAELNMSQRELASLAKIRQSTLCAVETGATDGRHSTMARICRALGCAVRPVPAHLVPLVSSTLSSTNINPTD